MDIKNILSDRQSVINITFFSLLGILAWYIARRIAVSPLTWCIILSTLLVIMFLVWKFGLKSLLFIFAFGWWYPGVRLPSLLSQIFPNATDIGILFFCAFCLFLAQSFINRKNIFLYPKYILFLIIFMLCGAVSLATGQSPNSIVAVRYFVRLCLLLPSLYILITNLLQKRRDIEMFVSFLLLGGAIYALLVALGMLGYFPATPAESYVDSDYDIADIRLARVFSSFEIPIIGPLNLSYNITGALFSLVATLGFGFYLASNKRFGRILGIFSAVISGFAMYLMAARAAMLGLLCGFGVISALNFKINKINFKDKIFTLFKLFFVIAAVFLIFLFILPLLDPSFYETLLTKVSLSYIVQDESFISRIEFLKYNTNFLLKNPLGTGFIRDLSSYGFYGVLVHNQFISIAFGTGILGLFMFLCFFWFSTRYIMRALGSKDHLSSSIAIYAIGVLACYSINAMFVDTVRKFGPDIFLIMIYGAAIAAIRLANNEGLDDK